jgi:glutathione S-transferase
MKLYVLPPSPRAFKVIALKNHLGIECEMHIVDLGKGDQLTPEYVAMNPNKKMPVLEDDGFVLWESNAILFYLASKKPQSGLWPSDVQRQADVLRWLAWESTHWDAESVGMVGFERVSKGVLRLGPADPAFISRGEQNFNRFLPEPPRSTEWQLNSRRSRASAASSTMFVGNVQKPSPGLPGRTLSAPALVALGNSRSLTGKASGRSI